MEILAVDLQAVHFATVILQVTKVYSSYRSTHRRV